MQMTRRPFQSRVGTVTGTHRPTCPFGPVIHTVLIDNGCQRIASIARRSYGATERSPRTVLTWISILECYNKPDTPPLIPGIPDISRA